MIERTAAAHGSQHGREVVAPTALDRLPHARSLRRRSMLHDVDQWQGRLAFGQIVTDVLAGIGFLAGIIEHVVDQLEGGAQMHAVQGERTLDLRLGMADDGTELSRSLEQLGGLVVDDLHVTDFVDIRIVTVHQLQYLAFRDDIGGIGQHLHDAHVVDCHHHLEGPRIEEIADQHAGGVAKGGIGGIAPAPQRRFVDHIVVQQRGGMNELDDGSQFVMMTAPVIQRTGSEQDQGRSHAFAAAVDDVFGNLPDKNHIGVQTVADHRIHRLHVGPDQGIKLFQSHDARQFSQARNVRGPLPHRQGRRTFERGLPALSVC